MKINNIPVREVGTNQGRKRGITYGSRCVKKNEVEHRKEIENIAKMKDLRTKGYSYGKIAEVFNSMKIPTKIRRGRWHGKTIYQIIHKE